MPFFKHQGHRLFYRKQGAGQLLLILPGNTASSAHQVGELEHFGERWRAVALDPWGTGRSDRLEPWPGDWFEQAAHDAAALVSHLKEERALVMGASGGAIIALWLAILHPERVRAVIADSVEERFDPEFLRLQLASRQARTPGQVGFWQMGHGADWEQVVEADSAFLLARGEEGDWFRGRLHEVRCPVLLTASLADEMLPDPGSQLEHMLRQMPQGRGVLFPSGSHPLMWSRPADFRWAADAFLASVAGT